MKLGFNDRFITIKYYRIRKGELGNLQFNQFEKLKMRIISILGKPISLNLLKEIKIYEKYLKNYKNYKMSNLISKKYHPFLKSDYFNLIDTKEKAYWLGFIYADGSIIELINKNRNNKSANRIKLSQNRKDRILIYRFCRTVGLNIKQIRNDKTWDSYEISFRNHQMVDDLMKHGVVYRKSKVIKLPVLNNHKLYLSFLLGYFDGYGERGSTRFFSGSKTDGKTDGISALLDELRIHRPLGRGSSINISYYNLEKLIRYWDLETPPHGYFLMKEKG